uniref:Uncharacterized protein n=1 Tax=Arundo donax TaxID=35708 RepID=A0A0A9AFX2_ARUDO
MDSCIWNVTVSKWQEGLGSCMACVRTSKPSPFPCISILNYVKNCLSDR